MLVCRFRHTGVRILTTANERASPQAKRSPSKKARESREGLVYCISPPPCKIQTDTSTPHKCSHFFEFDSGFNRHYSGSQRDCQQRSDGGDFINPEYLSVHSFGDVPRCRATYERVFIERVYMRVPVYTSDRACTV
jgi:hypothetical protein